MKHYFRRKCYQKRHYLLLEVLIAASIVLMCLVPLLGPQVAMVYSERDDGRSLQAERLLSNIHVWVVEQLYRNAIPWDQLLNGSSTPVDLELVSDAGYRADYYFTVLNTKGSSEHKAMLVELTIEIYPERGRKRTVSQTQTLFIERRGQEVTVS